MTGGFFLQEPADPIAWSPFLGARPVGELRAGSWRIRERWQQALGVPALGHLGDTASRFHELDEPPFHAGAPSGGKTGVIVARSDFAPATTRLTLPSGTSRLVHRGEAVGWMVAPGAPWVRSEAGPAVEVPGLLLRGSFDLVTALEELLPADCAALLATHGGPAPEGCLVLGNPSHLGVSSASIEPGVVFDVRGGPVIVAAGAQVLSGTRLEGPCHVGPGARVLGGVVRGSVIGPRSVVRGEVSASVFLGYANKAHDGFVGHSYLGHWVNLGAGTTTSNLKNTYGQVRLSIHGASIDTGRQFLGSLVGDHAKTAIGTMLSTGTVIGAGANVFGPAPGKYVPPFAWGLDGALVTEEGFMQVAGRVLPRRDVELTSGRRESLLAMYRRLARGASAR